MLFWRSSRGVAVGELGACFGMAIIYPLVPYLPNHELVADAGPISWGISIFRGFDPEKSPEPGAT